MLNYWWIVAAVVALGALLVLRRPSRLEAGLDRARKTGEVAGVVAAIEELPEGRHPNLWDQTIGSLWQEYHRPAALSLMMAAAVRSEAPIIQYWLKQALEVEPALAEEVFGQEFVDQYFQPQVAASCGRAGCCS